MSFNLPSLIQSNDSLFGKRNRDIDRLFNYLLNNFYQPISTSFQTNLEYISPKFDVSEDKNAYYVEMDIPGFEQKNVDVSVEGNILTIKGKKETSIEDKKDRKYFRKERVCEEFQRSMSLALNCKADKVEAKFRNGVLEVTIPKEHNKDTKKIEIKG